MQNLMRVKYLKNFHQLPVNTLNILCVLCVISALPGHQLLAQENDSNSKKSDARASRQALVSLTEFLAEVPAEQQPAKTKEFYLRDTDADMMLSGSELKAGLKGLKNPFRDKFAHADSDANGLVSQKEYLAEGGEKFIKASQRAVLQFDQNQDGQLTYPEYLETPQILAKPESQFRRWDRNADQSLELVEYLNRFAKPHRAIERFVYYSRDLDGDLKLSLKEFSWPPEKRKPHWKSNFAARDVNADRRLSHAEYFAPFVGGEWDKSARKEAVHFDRNADGFLSLEEYSWTPNAASAEQRFEFYDTDKNKQLSLKEYLQASHQSAKDLRVDYFRRDVNEDQQLTVAEFVEVAPPELNWKRAFALLDKNGDKKLSPKEYGDSQDGKAQIAAADYDGDGKLALIEFSRTPAAKLSLAERFELLDIDQSKTLTLVECIAFTKGVAHVQGQMVFYIRDRNADAVVDKDEYFTQLPDRKLNFEESYLAIDTNFDGRVSTEEYTILFLGGQYEKSSQREARSCDADDDGFLSKLEFFYTPRPDPSEEELFELLVENGRGKLRISECAKFEAIPHVKSHSASAYQQRLKTLENKIKLADKDFNGILTQAEFMEARQNIKRLSARAAEAAFREMATERKLHFIKRVWTGLTLLFAR
ncbi:MAG: hypothetical protein JKY95_19100 [Planctomycetaceae bacterium]|nr:hypothetical protein [Planctomycetaceae bacterium]